MVFQIQSYLICGYSQSGHSAADTSQAEVSATTEAP